MLVLSTLFFLKVCVFQFFSFEQTNTINFFYVWYKEKQKKDSNVCSNFSLFCSLRQLFSSFKVKKLHIFSLSHPLPSLSQKHTPRANFINMLMCSFYMHRFQKRKKTVKSSLEKKLTKLLCCCISADLRFTLCAQHWWNWPQNSLPPFNYIMTSFLLI